MRVSIPWWLPFGKVPEIEPKTLKRWLDEGRPLQFIDSRTSLEYKQGTIGDAQHAPVTELPGSIDRLELDPERPIVLLCLSGHRSRPGTRLLRNRGFEAYSLQGGVMAWKRKGYQVQNNEF